MDYPHDTLDKLNALQLITDNMLTVTCYSEDCWRITSIRGLYVEGKSFVEAANKAKVELEKFKKIGTIISWL